MIFAEKPEVLLHRHTYVVLMNETTANPRIVRVLKEIAKEPEPPEIGSV